MKTGTVRFIGYVTRVDGDSSDIELLPEYRPGLDSLDLYSHAIILYWFHERDNENHRSVTMVTPRRHQETEKRGVFSTRSPSRPNPIGHTIVEITKVHPWGLTVKGLDANKDSPILDIKAYIPRSDSIPYARAPEWTRRGPET